MKLHFNDVESIFQNYTIWVGGKVMYWYRKAWGLLDESGLTTYETDLEYAPVILRAYTLATVYMCGKSAVTKLQLDTAL